MSLSTTAGFVLGFAVILSALLLGHVDLMTLLKPEAFVVVFGGTLTAVLISFSPEMIQRAIHAVSRPQETEGYSAQECIQYVSEVAHFIRMEGALALQPMIKGVRIPFLRKGLQQIIDQRSDKALRQLLSTEIEVTYREDLELVRVFETAGGVSPTMGIIGTVIGLMHVVQVLNDPTQIGAGVAGAFSATLFGVALSNLFLLPMAGQLRARAKEEWFRKTILFEGLMSIHAGEHPLLVEEKLQAFLSETPQGLKQHNGMKAQERDVYPEPTYV